MIWKKVLVLVHTLFSARYKSIGRFILYEFLIFKLILHLMFNITFDHYSLIQFEF